MPDSEGRPIFYLDTSVLLDIIDGRRQSARVLLERIQENHWPAITSPFSVLEMLEAKKADKWAEKSLAEGMSFFQVLRRLGARRTGRSRLRPRDLAEVYRDLRAKLLPLTGIVTFPEPTPRLLNRAEDISAATNIEATDIFHLAAALEFGCDILVTADGDFANMARDYLIAVVPESFDRALEQFYRSST